MKKLILLSILSLSLIGANAQLVCVKNAVTAPGKSYILPDSATGIAHACAGKPYDETMYLKVFKDTSFSITLGGFPVTLVATTDSVIIDLTPSTIGLPSYITSISSVPAALPPNATNNFKHLNLKGDSLACIRIMGVVPAGTPAASIPLSIPFILSAKVTLFGAPYTDTTIQLNNNNYDFVIDGPGTGACAVGVSGIYKNIANITAVPNPATSVLNLTINATNAEPITLSVLNAMGQVVFTKATKSVIGANNYTIDVSPFANGIYTLNIQGTEGSTVKKFSKQ
jgi:Secretion system C-terminal sorting domain